MKNCPTCRTNYPTDFAVCPRDGSTLTEIGAWSEGAVIRGKYRVVAKIGQGGMGAVYKALHVAFDELRALKVINTSLMADEMFVKRFKHEAVITRRLQHPNAVRVDDIDEAEDGRPFIVMEFIEGQSLKKLIQDQGALPVPRVCAIIKQAASALEAAHQLGMIHRDIKPENIVLLEAPAGEQVKVLDFGIAKIKEARASESSGMTLTGTGVVIGTPQYMSPEQAMGKRGDQLDARADLYSLGVVMYQMLSGELPFKAETTMEMILAHMQTPPMPLRALHPELQIPDPIAAVVMRLLEKDRELRPASARALIEEIEQAEKAPPQLAATRIAGPAEVYSVEDSARALRESLKGGQPPMAGGARPAPPPQRGAQPPARAESLPPSPPKPPASEPTERVRPPAAPPHPAPQPARAVQRPVSAAPVAAQKSRVGLWVSLAIVLLALVGGGIYFIQHPQPKLRAPEATAAPQASPAGGAATQAPTGPTGASSPQVNVPPENAQSAPTRSGVQAKGGDQAGVASETQANASAAGPRRGVSRESEKEENDTSSAENRANQQSAKREKVKAAIAMGDIYFNRGEYDNAIGEYRKGLEVAPFNPLLHRKIQRAQKARAAEQRLLH